MTWEMTWGRFGTCEKVEKFSGNSTVRKGPVTARKFEEIKYIKVMFFIKPSKKITLSGII